MVAADVWGGHLGLWTARRGINAFMLRVVRGSAGRVDGGGVEPSERLPPPPSRVLVAPPAK